MKYRAGLISLALLAGLSTDAGSAEFTYSYLEVAADLSKTRNTATAPLSDDSDGRLVGIAGSWEVFDSIYIKGAWSRETKEFGNEVAGVPLDLESRQTLSMLGAGYHFEPGERVSVYAEALAIVDFEVEHTVPLVTRSAMGSPAVTTTDSMIEGDGFAAALGVRYRVGENVDLEGQLSHMRTEADVLRTGADISDSETMLRIGGQFYTGHGLSVGGYFSYSKHTDDNFDHIRKLGAVLRYYF